MTLLTRTLACSSAAIILFAGGCVETAGDPSGLPPPPPASIAIARVGNVSGNGAIIRSATGGQVRAVQGGLLYSGDSFATDAQSTMDLTLLRTEGGTISASRNTDPLLQDAACFAISFFHRGTLEVNGHHICVHTDGGVVLMQDSDVVYAILPSGAVRVTVKEGRVEVVGQPGRGATTGQSFEIRGRTIIGPAPVIGGVNRTTIPKLSGVIAKPKGPPPPVIN